MSVILAAQNPQHPAPLILPKPMRIKLFGHHLPVHPWEAATLAEDIKALADARKTEEKLRELCEQNLGKSAKAAKHRQCYLRSLQCLQAKMLEANSRRPYAVRLSLRQIIEASKQYKVCIKLDEPVIISLRQKSSGVGWRTIMDFGPVARGAQLMVVELLRMTYQPAPFQYTRLGVYPAIAEAIRLITKEEYTHVAELDITGHYPSFQGQALMETLPLPKSAAREIVLATSAPRVCHPKVSPLFHNPIIHPTSSGIPQGSASSSAVAEWSVSHLKMIKIVNIVLINYADNFFLFGKSEISVKFALAALRLAVAKLPGGVFKTHPEPTDPEAVKTVAAGFRMLGCVIRQGNDGLEVVPTEANLQKLDEKFLLEEQHIAIWLHEACKQKDSGLRVDGIQAFLRLASYARSWIAAYKLCTDIATIEADLEYRLNSLVDDFYLSDDELKAAADASTNTRYYPSSNSSY